MQYRRVGRSGLKISALALGAGNWGYQSMDEKKVRECVAVALDAGINYFDNAQSYTNGQSEQIMGRVFKSLRLPRIKYVIATKFMYGLAERYWEPSDSPNDRHTLNRKFLLDGIDGSLQRLQLDFVDIVYCHRADPETPIEETVWAMHDIIERGKALYWGTSEWTAYEIRAAWDIAERHHLHKPIVEQPEFNLLRRRRVEQELARLCADIGIGIAAYSPLSGGMLTGKYRKGAPPGSRGADESMSFLRDIFLNEQRNQIVNSLEKFAREMGCTLAQMSLAWCLSNPNVCTAIVGATSPLQLADNLLALQALPKLTPALAAAMAEVVGNYSGDAYQVPKAAVPPVSP
jgi:voltage-dependent potassium channel beta subunit